MAKILLPDGKAVLRFQRATGRGDGVRQEAAIRIERMPMSFFRVGKTVEEKPFSGSSWRVSMSFKVILGLAVIGAMSWSMLPAWSHHAHGNYTETVIDLEGKITQLHKIVPHSWIYLEVTRDGQKRVWALEGGGPRDQNIKVGDTIKARCHPLRDGNPVCLLGFVKAPDGSVRDWDGNQAPPKDF